MTTVSKVPLKYRPWSDSGRPIDATTIQEVLEQGELDWPVSKRPLATTFKPRTIESGKINPGPLDGDCLLGVHALEQELLDVPNIYAIVRDDINHVFAAMGEIYQPLANAECLSILEDLMKETGITVERAGMFNEGANAWVMVHLDEQIEIAGMPIDQYIAISWSHDGTQKLTASFLYRPQNNILLNPKMPGVPHEVAIRHTKNAKKRVLEAKTILTKQRLHAQAFAEKAEDMASATMRPTEFKEYLKALFPGANKPDLDVDGEIIENHDTRLVDTLMGDFGDLDVSMAQTVWGGFVTVASYSDTTKGVRVHGRDKITDEAKATQKENETRLRSNLTGSSAKLKQQAWKVFTADIV